MLWTALRFGFTWYATSIANYDSAFGPLSTGITLIVFLYFASVIVLLGAEFARARTLDDEIGRSSAPTRGCCRSPFDPLPAPAPQPRSGRVRWALVAAARFVGVIVGRLTKRDD